ncbi:hypothetical protein KQI63_08755 [bacterium]|nr:hypothetical protein [bacterium]
MTDPTKDRSALAMGGGTMVGLGIGFFYLTTSVFIFVGCILAGIGVGLLVAAFIPKAKE